MLKVKCLDVTFHIPRNNRDRENLPETAGLLSVPPLYTLYFDGQKDWDNTKEGFCYRWGKKELTIRTRERGILKSLDDFSIPEEGLIVAGERTEGDRREVQKYFIYKLILQTPEGERSFEARIKVIMVD